MTFECPCKGRITVEEMHVSSPVWSLNDAKYSNSGRCLYGFVFRLMSWSPTQRRSLPVSHTGKEGLHKHGASRSIVRRIGSSLPISTGTRLFIQLPGSSGSEVEKDATTSKRLGPKQEGLTLASYLREPTKIISKAVGLFNLDTVEGEGGGPVRVGGDDGAVSEDSEVFGVEEGDREEQKQEETLEKISALESELARLKAQIAVYALSEAQDERDIPEAPPPPPPPLNTATTPAQPKPVRMSDELPSSVHQEPLVCATPQSDMSSVLKDIGSVKLRSVAKSPGGTPLRRLQEHQQPTMDDPAAIIAQALRRKFSHKVFRDSPDKENLDRSDMSLSAGFESPTVKLFD